MRFISLLLLFLAADLCSAESLPRFPDSAVWNRSIVNTPKNSSSALMISATGGWGNGNTFQIDQSMHVIHVLASEEATVRMATVVEGDDGYYLPDCEPLSSLTFPLPTGGAIEGRSDYSCAGDDCHLLIMLDGSRKLYESYESNVNSNGQLQSTCVVIWDLNKVYPPKGRGEQCTSTDAAGFPVASLLFNADEVYAASLSAQGDIGHAIRFILPNNKMAKASYVHPATHAGAPSGNAAMISYGSRLRLSWSESQIEAYSANVAAQVVLRSMTRYGIVLADGGNIALTAESDQFTTHKWAEFGFDEENVYLEQMISDVPMTAFDVIDTGPRIALNDDCARTQTDFIFIDSYDF